MSRISKVLMRFRVAIVLVVILLAAFVVGIKLIPSQAAPCAIWHHCPITQYFGQNQEHGVDLATHGLSITALVAGTITYDKWTCWTGSDECIQDITWKLDKPACHNGKCMPYAYVQIASSSVKVNQHVSVGTVLGRSGSFIEFGLTPDWAYGVSNWRWGIDPRFLL